MVKWLRNEEGFTLLEMLVGLLVVMLVVWAVGDVSISGWRAMFASNDEYAGYAGSVNGVDWFTRDVRRGTAVTTSIAICPATPGTLTGGSTQLGLTVLPATTGGTTHQVTYTFNNTAGTLTRLDQTTGVSNVVMHGVSGVQFCSESNGLALHMQVQVKLQTGGNYQFDSHANLRTKPKSP